MASYRDKLFKWCSKDLQLLRYFKGHPYFSVKYQSSAVRLDERESFKKICNQAGEDLKRFKLGILRKMSGIIMKYAKLYLLISRGEVMEKEVLNHQCTKAYVKGKLNFLRVFVRGFTDVDIPQAVHDYYDRLFKVNKLSHAIAAQNSEVSIDHVNMHLRKLKSVSGDDLNSMDLAFVNNIIKQSFEEGEQNSCKNLMFQALGFHKDKAKKVKKDTSREVAVTEPSCSLLPNKNIIKKITSNMHIIETITLDSDEEYIVENDSTNHSNVAKPSASACSVYAHTNVKKEVDDSEMLKIENSVSDGNSESSLINKIPNYTYIANSELTQSGLPKIGITQEINNVYEVNIYDPEDEIGKNMIHTNNVAKTKSVCPVLPGVNTNIDNIYGRGLCSGIYGQGVFNPLPSILPYRDDLNNYMKDIADYLCTRLPMDKRREFLNKVDVIVSGLLEE